MNEDDDFAEEYKLLTLRSRTIVSRHKMLHSGFDIRIACEEHFKNTISETCSDCIQIPLFNQLPDGNLIKPSKEFYIILLTT